MPQGIVRGYLSGTLGEKKTKLPASTIQTQDQYSYSLPNTAGQTMGGRSIENRTLARLEGLPQVLLVDRRICKDLSRINY